MPILRTVAMLVVLAMLALPASGRAARSQPSLLASVRPLSMTMTVYMDPETHIQFSLNVCTASSINAVTHLWLTAAHCVQHLELNEAGIPIAVVHPLTIDGHPVYLVKVDLALDLAILFTPDLVVPALRLADRAPFWEDPVRVIGYPFGYSSAVLTAGNVSNPEATIPGEVTPYLFVTAFVAPGNSGSPIVNARGEIVSVLQIGWGRGYGPGGGSPYARLRAFAGTYFKR